MAPRFVARQLSHPRGPLGPVFRYLMNRLNAQMNAFALTKLAVAPEDRVLEIGFGGGPLLPHLIGRASFVCGLDRSEQSVAAANRRFAQAVRTGRAVFRIGAVETLPFDDGHFTRVITVNTVYFWKSLAAGFAEIHRVSSPGGLVVIGFLPKEFMDRMNMPADIFTPRAPEELVAAMGRAGFQGARIEKPNATTKWSVAIAGR